MKTPIKNPFVMRKLAFRIPLVFLYSLSLPFLVLTTSGDALFQKLLPSLIIGLILFVFFTAPWLDLIYVAAVPLQVLFLSCTLKILSIPFCFGTLAILGGYLFIRDNYADLPWLQRVLGGTAISFGGLISALIFVPLYRSGARLMVPTGEHLLEVDPRNPVLYLRSFQVDEEATKTEPAGFFVGDQPLMFLRPTDEQLMARALRRFGPVVAVGNPNQTWPAVGVPRLHLDSERWQHQVLALIKDCRMLFVRVGDTPGLNWEISQVVAFGQFQKLVLIVGTRRDQYDAFRHSFDSMFPKSLPELEGVNPEQGSIRGFIIFDQDGEAEFVTFAKKAWKPILERMKAVESF